MGRPSAGLARSIVPNAGLPQRIEGQFVYAAAPAYFGDEVPPLPGCRRAHHRRLLRHDARAHPPHAPRARRSDHAPRPRSRSAVADEKPRDRRRRPGRRSRSAPSGSAAEPPPPTRLAAAADARTRFVVSVEIDPPRSVRIERTIEAARLLQDAGVDVVNISDSAMARVRMGALAVAFGVQHDLDLECLVHFTTRDRNLMALESELLGAHALGVRNILALTGDPPRVGDYPTRHRHLGRRLGRPDRHPCAGSTGARTRPASRSAARPASRSPARSIPRRTTSTREIERLAAKIDAGAHLIMTQPIYAREQWERFMDRAAARWPSGLPRPVLLGVLPLHTARHAEFLHNEVPGITIPAEIRAAMHAAGERAAEVGLEMAHRAAGERLAPLSPRHVRHAQLRPLRAGRGAGPADQVRHAHRSPAPGATHDPTPGSPLSPRHAGGWLAGLRCSCWPVLAADPSAGRTAVPGAADRRRRLRLRRHPVAGDRGTGHPDHHRHRAAHRSRDRRLHAVQARARTRIRRAPTPRRCSTSGAWVAPASSTAW